MNKKIVALFLFLVCELTWAHARWSLTGNTPPRNTSTGLKNSPCGGVVRGSTPKVFQAGSTITVQWEETINHPGRFEIYFSPANDNNFTLLKTITDTLDDGSTPHQYSTSITLPNVNCAACTLQLIQVMTENPASPSLYYSCSDIQLTGSSSVSGSGTTNPPAENCP